MARLNDGPKSCRAAGYEASDNNLRVESARLMAKAEIRREVLKQRQYYLASIGADKDRLIAETMARAGITHDGKVWTPYDFIEKINRQYRRTNQRTGETTEYDADHWALIDKQQLPEEARRMVAAIKISYSPGGEENIEIKFHDQLKAIELVAKLAHLLQDPKDLDQKVSAEEHARKIRDALKQMDDVNGPDAPYVEPQPGDQSTH